MNLNVFTQDAFSMTELTNAVNLLEYVPNFLGSLGLFTFKPTALTSVFVEQRGDVLVLVPNAPRGGVAQPLQATNANSTPTQKRVARTFNLCHLPQDDFLPADEIQGVRAFGSQSELEILSAKVMDRLTAMRRNLELTWENLMLGCVRGSILDADGTTEIYNLFTEFGVSQESEIDFDLDNASPASGVVRYTCDNAVRLMMRNLKGASAATRFVGICGDTFWNQLTAHSEVRQTFINWQAAEDLRKGAAFSMMRFGGIDWYNYRGTNDGTTELVTATKCHIFPVGVPGLFDMYFGPANKNQFVNTLGLPLYAFQYVDPKDRGVALEMQSNPLPICTQPKVLLKGKNT